MKVTAVLLLALAAQAVVSTKLGRAVLRGKTTVSNLLGDEVMQDRIADRTREGVVRLDDHNLVLLQEGVKNSNTLGNALGLASGSIPDSQLSASSCHGDNCSYYGPRNARLNGGHDYGGFIPNHCQAGQWIQVDLGRIRPVGGIATQGRAGGTYWLRSYFVQYSSYGNDWNWYSEGGASSRKEFSANWDGNTIVSHVFERPFNARYVRIVVNQFQGWPVFRMELYAPFNDDSAGGAALGISTNEIPNSAFSASSVHGNNWGAHAPHMCRLYSTNGGWLPLNNREGEWVQVDLGSEKEVGGVATQGYVHGSHWITSYTLSYSADGNTWTQHKDECNTATNKAIFDGNRNHWEVVKHQLQKPFRARFVRLTVNTWRESAWPSLRWELYTPESTYQRLGAPVGIQNPNVVPNSAMTASSAHGNNWSYYGPQNARLNQNLNWGGWIPQNARQGEWIQVDLEKVTEIGGIATQSAVGSSHWITRFSIVFSIDGKTWHTYLWRGSPFVFTGNSNNNAIVEHVFAFPFLARYVRVVAEAFSNWPALRFELYKPSTHIDAQIKSWVGAALGMEAGTISDDAIKASSVYATPQGACDPKYARLNSKKGAGSWCAQNNDGSQWIQVQVDPDVPVGGIAVQGRAQDSELYAGALQWITGYRVSHSVDGNNWAFVQQYEQDRIFRGSLDSSTVRLEALNGGDGIKTKFIRIHPEGWNGHISLRFEIYNTARFQKAKIEKEIADRKAKEEAEAKAAAEAAAAAKKAKEEAEAAKKAEEEKLAKLQKEKEDAEDAERKAATSSAKAAAAAALETVNQKIKEVKAANDEKVRHAEQTAATAEANSNRIKAEMKAAQVKLETIAWQNQRLNIVKKKIVELKGFIAETEGQISNLDAERAAYATKANRVDAEIAVLTEWLTKRGDAGADEEEKERKAEDERNGTLRKMEEEEKAANGESSDNTTPVKPANEEECTCAVKAKGDTDSTVGPDAWPKGSGKIPEQASNEKVPVVIKAN